MKHVKTIDRKLPRVVLIGRANVGKSTLFNKLTEKYEAMVSDIAGTTRDIKRSSVAWQDLQFELVDTGGLNGKHLKKFTIANNSVSSPKFNIDDDFETEIDVEIIRKSLEIVLQADLLLFVTDVRDGLMPEDKEIADWLKKQNLPVILVSNKADGATLRQQSAEFFQLGMDDPLSVSAASGSGTGDLLDKIVSILKYTGHPAQDAKEQGHPFSISFIGRPNVGKSSLVNTILGYDRVIVSDTPHTTREPIDTAIEYHNTPITLIDTAGIRRKAHIPLKSLEKSGVTLSLKSMQRSDVIFLVVDGSLPIGKQDLKLAHEALNARIGIVVVINKIDLLDNLKNADHIQVKRAVQKTFNFIKWAPVVLLSAKTGKHVSKILDHALAVYENYNRMIPADELDSFKMRIVQRKGPPKKRTAKSRPKIHQLVQISTSPPHFEVTYSGTGMLPLVYLKYFEKELRAAYNFEGTPIIIHQRKI